MLYKPTVKEKMHFLHLPAIYVSKEPFAVSTILGTCVAVCLHNPVLHIGVVNHFIMPRYQEERRHLGKSLPDRSSLTRFGNVAIEKFLQKMFSMGANRDYLQAKSFGRMSRPHANMLYIGERKAEVARLYLKHLGVPVLVQQLAGQHTHSGKVLMKLLFHSSHV